MNLYLLQTNRGFEYDTYDSCIVAANSLPEACKIHPRKHPFDEETQGWEDSFTTWATHISQVKATLIGRACKNIKEGVVLASYNAG